MDSLNPILEKLPKCAISISAAVIIVVFVVAYFQHRGQCSLGKHDRFLFGASECNMVQPYPDTVYKEKAATVSKMSKPTKQHPSENAPTNNVTSNNQQGGQTANEIHNY